MHLIGYILNKLSVSMFRLIIWLIKAFPNVYIRLIKTYIGLSSVSIRFIDVNISPSFVYNKLFK